MKTLITDDFPVVAPQPNARALWRIMAAFILAAGLCLAVCIALIARDARPKGMPHPTPVAAPPGISGAWKGTTALLGRGICDLKLEIAEDQPSRFRGFSSFSCTQADPLMSKPHHPDLRAEVLSRLNPNAAILTGTLQNGTIRFRSEKPIGADINGCSVSAFSVTRFGAGQVAPEWQDCGGGAVLMQKTREGAS